ncbi:MAG: YidC/Oxa1 family insertase periplasmic-domain containing protein [Verrucomicrobiota bacterium]
MTEDGVVEVAHGTVPYLSLVHGEELLRGETVEVLESSDSHAVFERRYRDPKVKLTETWRLVADRPYLITYSVNIENTGDTDVPIQEFGVACGTMSQEKTPGVGKAGTAGLVELAVAIMPPDERRPDSYDPKKIGKLSAEQRDQLAGSPASWAAVHNKYFVLHCEPANGSFRGVLPGKITRPSEDGEDHDSLYAVAPLARGTLSPGEVRDLTFQGYGGPKKLALLKDMDNGLKSLMRLDLFLFFHPRWMEHLTNTILWALVGLNEFFDSKWGYGYAIMVITFVIKMLFWPLTHTSTVSMQRMQMLQPQLKELKKQYKDQPQKMQQKTMELYKQNKVNPLGGCLPILLQIPVFFALFNTFRSAIELRQASFLWVPDLSLPDTLPFLPFGFPLRPLALLMGATMLLQQVTTPTSGDPQQKKMMMFMTLFFVFIFYTMPAGLTLYWSVNQILTIVQNMISRRLHTIPKAPPTGTANA